MTASIYHAFSQPIAHIEGIGPASAKKLNKAGILHVGDLLFHLPKAWLDDQVITPISQLSPKQSARIQGVIDSRRSSGFGRKATIHIKLTDNTGQSIALSFFHAPYMMSDARLQEGQTITARGSPERWGSAWQMTHPEWCTVERFQAGWHAQYSALAGFSGKKVAIWLKNALKTIPIHEKSPLDALLGEQPSLLQALLLIHQNCTLAPDSTLMQQARQRLQCEELLVYLSLMQQQRKLAEINTVPLANSSLESSFIASLPYTLTPAQQQVWQEISADLASGKRMHRLLQGDVGAGKTWIAALGMVRCFAHGLQSAIMAPTEVLAQQHAITLRQLLAPFDIQVALLTGSSKKRERNSILKQLADGSMPVVVGTHALLTDDVCFKNLGLAMVDEQHRFGVQQRWALSKKGAAVHLLAMTATPIPRSLALALYGDMYLSIMVGLPAGRKPIATRVLAASKMPALADAIARMLAENGRIYWIVPRIDEDEDCTSVEQRLATLQSRFPQEKVLGLHGKMKPKVKQEALQSFADGSCRILVSTTVVEVGVNVPEARVMVVEHADMYGLAQLHQLRGRVGRSSAQSYCMLIPSQDAGKHALARLDLMTTCHDGLVLAESDLQQRGAGDAIGTQQSGDAGFRLIDPTTDASLIGQWHNHPLLQQFQHIPEDMLQFWRPLADEVD